MKWIKLTGYREYSETLSLMESQLLEVINGKEEVIYCLEHEDVYTAGVSALENELLADSIPVHKIGRGGKYTYHGPGQLVVYPIINLANHSKDLHLYIGNLEGIVIRSLAKINIEAFTIEGKVGIWVMQSNIPAKIAAIGIRVKKWVTYHGIAINVNCDLDKFSGIIPCGISDLGVTSVKKMGIEVSIDEFEKIIKEEFIRLYYS